jgi:hypothetical protein
MFRQTKPEWDTPPHGDFASYVERLSGAGKGASPTPSAQPRKTPEPPPTTGRVLPSGRTAGPDTASLQALAPLLGPLSRGLKVVQVVLLLFLVVQAVALFGLGNGAWPSLMVTALAWWAIGRVVRLTGALGASGQEGLGQKYAVLQERLKQLAETQRKTGKTK